MKKVTLIVILNLLLLHSLYAVRPFITDDAATIGLHKHELATWAFASGDHLEFWHSYATNITERLEVNVCAFWGVPQHDDETYKQFSFTAPLIQFKYLFREFEPNKYPGISIAAGSDLPFGRGDFVPCGWGCFGFLALTQCFGEEEDVLIHASFGGNYVRLEGINNTGITWGIGTQIKVYKGFHSVFEIVSGDPFVFEAGLACQFGCRYFVSQQLQFDLAFGKGFAGDNRMASWITGGIRYVLPFGNAKENELDKNS